MVGAEWRRYRPGLGRPTKKDRRDIEVFMSDNYLDEIDWDDEE